MDNTCPKCGAVKSRKDPLIFECDSRPLVDRPGIWQSPACRIRELTADLQAHKTLLDWTFGLALNANDLFGYACADCIYLDDLLVEHALALIKKHGSSGLVALMARIDGAEKPIGKSRNNWEAAKADAALVPDDLIKLAERWREVEAMAKAKAEIERLTAENERLRADLAHANAALNIIHIYSGQRSVEVDKALASPHHTR